MQALDDSVSARPLFSARKRLFMASILLAFLFPYVTWKQAAGCALLLLLFNALILPWMDVDVSKQPWAGGGPSPKIALSPGERVAIPHARESRVRGYLLRLASLLRLRAARDPSPGPRRLVKAPDAVHPLPLGEGENPIRATPNTPTGIVLYPISILALIVLYRNHLHIAAAAWAIMALGDGMATVVGGAVPLPFVAGSQAQKPTAEMLRGVYPESTAEILLPRPRDPNDKRRAQHDRPHVHWLRSWRSHRREIAVTLPWNPQKTWAGFLSFAVAGTVGAYVLTRWIAPKIPADKTFIVCAAAALLGAVFESLPIALDDNITVPLVVGAFLFCAFLVERSQLESNLPYLGRRIVLAIGVNLALALLAWRLKAASPSGAICGFLLGTAIYLGYGYKSFLLLFAFVLLGSVATRLGFAKKAARGVAERRGGARSWREALANLLAAAFFALLVITTHHEAAFLIALVAALAEAAGDTVSSEIGQWASDRAYLITTFKLVPAGEDGGISLAGTAAGFAASAIIMGLGLGLGLCGPYRSAGPAIALGAAAAGNLFDSFLGATIQRRGLVTNGMVNFAGTSIAGALALGLALRLGL
jgi:uncharacterized protein (TIGR00297 family)